MWAGCAGGSKAPTASRKPGPMAFPSLPSTAKIRSIIIATNRTGEPRAVTTDTAVYLSKRAGWRLPQSRRSRGKKRGTLLQCGDTSGEYFTMQKRAVARTMKAINFTILALRRRRLWRRRTARMITTMAMTSESSVVMRLKVPQRDQPGAAQKASVARKPAFQDSVPLSHDSNQASSRCEPDHTGFLRTSLQGVGTFQGNSKWPMRVVGQGDSYDQPIPFSPRQPALPPSCNSDLNFDCGFTILRCRLRANLSDQRCLGRDGPTFSSVQNRRVPDAQNTRG
jgi:hypothetical protein